MAPGPGAAARRARVALPMPVGRGARIRAGAGPGRSRSRWARPGVPPQSMPLSDPGRPSDDLTTFAVGDHGLGERVDRDVLPEELPRARRPRRTRCRVEQRSSRVEVISRPRPKVIGPAPACARSSAGCRSPHAIDLPRGRRLSEIGVEPQHLAQRGRALAVFAVDQGEVVEREMADQAPGRLAERPGQGAPGRLAMRQEARRGRLAETLDRRDRRAPSRR